ncbi:MAG: hypothetical protein ACK551_02610 [Vampirovibrionales bacterium]
MKPSLSQQSSLYAQVYKAKGTKGALAPVGSKRNEKDTKASPQENQKTFSPTKAIALLGGGLLGLTGLYMGVGQKIKTFLFGEASKPAAPSIPPTPVLFEVVEDVPVPEKNPVARAAEAVGNSLQAGLGKLKQGAEKTGSAIVLVAQKGVQEPFQAGIGRQERAFNWLEKLTLGLHNATLGRLVRPPSNASPLVAEIAPIEVPPPISPPTLNGALEQATTTLGAAVEGISNVEEEPVISHKMTNMTEFIKAGFEREQDLLEWAAKAWEQTGYDPLTGKWKSKAKASAHEVIDVVATHIPETAEDGAKGAINQTRIMQNSATRMAIAGAEYMPTMTTGSVGFDLLAIFMHVLYGLGTKAVRTR